MISMLGNICTQKFITVLFVTTKVRKQPECPLTDEWECKICYKHRVE